MCRCPVNPETDAEQIRDLMVTVESDEASRWFENGERPYIPGFASVDMQKYHMWNGTYYKIISGDSFAGVILLSSTGREHARIDRFYIHPMLQSEGVGTKVIELIEKLHPSVKIWTLDTTQKSPRNHRFYEKNGYELTGEDEYERYYKKEIGKSNDYARESAIVDQNFSNQSFRNCKMEQVDLYNVTMRNSNFTNMNLSKGLYQNINISNTRFTNTNMSRSIIGDSNLSNIEICHASLAGAYIHDITLGSDKESSPLVMERCEMSNSRIVNSNLQNLSIENCNIDGMSIDGIRISDLLETYKRTHGGSK